MSIVGRGFTECRVGWKADQGWCRMPAPQPGADKVKIILAVLLVVLGLFGAAEAQACRIAPRPDALRSLDADAIALVLITDLQVDGATWRATGAYRGTLMGHVPQREFSFDNRPAFAGELVVSCNQSWPPKLGRYGVVYLRRTADGLRVHRVYPYWWARASHDPRLAPLDRLPPLGAARDATSKETRLLDLTEPRIELPAGVSELSRYTRVYARASPTIVTGMLLQSRTPRRLIVDSTEELPTEETCGCKLIHVRVHLDDLWAAGQLPPFNP
ncbi:hypothetical protein [Sphingosinicella sp. CPCC 101087]|uniref:hypothetical protein n=1 Tax=Sphingosinicella sp. CPCC 101087 TaxID=2497754 RepID=UPI00101D065C|nr:hypothetical protein [Sphingosinicella sp. CPCC 101087]